MIAALWALGGLLVGTCLGLLLGKQVQFRILKTHGDLEAVFDALMREVARLPHAAQQRALYRIWESHALDIEHDANVRQEDLN